MKELGLPKSHARHVAFLMQTWVPVGYNEDFKSCGLAEHLARVDYITYKVKSYILVNGERSLGARNVVQDIRVRYDSVPAP